jgi:protein required for attachment to host cells
MGESWRTIARRAQLAAGSRTTARMWIISPDPELMAHVPETERFNALRNVTEGAVEAWYDDNGWGRPEYSYVLHDKEIDREGVHARQKMLHAHVITSGTYDASVSARRLDHFVSRHRIANLHDVTHEKTLGELERVLGRARTQQILEARNRRVLEEKYPGFHERQKQRGLHGRIARMQTVADVSAIMQREKERKQRRRKSREQTRRERREDLRIYTHCRQNLARRDHEASYASM